MELVRVSHTRRHLLSSGPDAESAKVSQNAERKAASAALQGLIGTRFQQANFLEVVSLAGLTLPGYSPLLLDPIGENSGGLGLAVTFYSLT